MRVCPELDLNFLRKYNCHEKLRFHTHISRWHHREVDSDVNKGAWANTYIANNVPQFDTIVEPRSGCKSNPNCSAVTWWCGLNLPMLLCTAAKCCHTSVVMVQSVDSLNCNNSNFDLAVAVNAPVLREDQPHHNTTLPSSALLSVGLAMCPKWSNWLGGQRQQRLRFASLAQCHVILRSTRPAAVCAWQRCCAA